MKEKEKRTLKTKFENVSDIYSFLFGSTSVLFYNIYAVV